MCRCWRACTHTHTHTHTNEWGRGVVEVKVKMLLSEVMFGACMHIHRGCQRRWSSLTVRWAGTQSRWRSKDQMYRKKSSKIQFRIIVIFSETTSCKLMFYVWIHHCLLLSWITHMEENAGTLTHTHTCTDRERLRLRWFIVYKYSKLSTILRLTVEFTYI